MVQAFEFPVAVKSKVKLSHYRPCRHEGGEEIKLLFIPDLGSRWRPSFTPRENTPGTYWIGGWVGLRASLDTEARGKILCPCWGLNPVVQSVVTFYTELPWLPYYCMIKINNSSP
jgi:hypothetical protein